MFKKQSAVRTKGKVKRRIIDPSKRMLLGQILIGVLLFTFVGLLGTALWYGTRIESLTLKTITATGGETINLDHVIAAAETQLEGTYIGFIPRRFAWWYPEHDVYTALSAIPRIKNPELERVSGTELAVTFEEYVPYALWCKEREAGECLLIDNTGYAFGPAPKLKGGALIRYRTLGKEPAVLSSLAEPAQLKTMAEFMNLVKAGGRFEIAAVETDIAGDVFYIVSGGGEFKAALRDSATQVYDNLLTIISSKEFSNIKPGNFQYIDLRFGNKVFVNEEKSMIASTTATSTETTPIAETASSSSL